MASNTLLLDWGAAGVNLYGLLRSANSGQYWNGTATESFSAANYGTYAVPLAEEGGAGQSGLYRFTVPAGLPAAPPECSWDLAVRVRAGGGPALTDAPASGASIAWDGQTLIDEGQVNRYTRALVIGKRMVGTSSETLSDADGTTLLATLPLSPAGGPFTQIGPKS